MSAEEAVREARRIFVTNTVDQARDYLGTITRGIAASDARLKEVVGRSYRELIAACDQVAGMGGTCRRVAELRRGLRDGGGRNYFGRGAAAGGEGEEEEAPREERDKSSLLLGARYNNIVFQQQCISMESLLGIQEVQRAAYLLHHMKKNYQNDNNNINNNNKLNTSNTGSSNGINNSDMVMLYETKLQQAVRNALRKGADDSARHHMTQLMHAVQRGEGAGRYSPAQRAAAKTHESDDKMMADVLTHMTEAHEALAVAGSLSTPAAALKLMDVVAGMIESDFQLLTKVIQEGERSKTHNNNNNNNNNQSTDDFGDSDIISNNGSRSKATMNMYSARRKTDWLRVILPLPPWLLDDGDNSQDLKKWMSSSIETTHGRNNNNNNNNNNNINNNNNNNNGGGVHDDIIALHVMQRTQQLFFHLVAYVASMQPTLGGVRGDTEKRFSFQQQQQEEERGGRNDGEEENVNEYIDHQKQQRSLQFLLSLRERLVTQQQQEQQEQQQQGEEGKKQIFELSDHLLKHMDVNSPKEMFSNSLRSNTEELGDASLNASSSLMRMSFSSLSNTCRRTHVRTKYRHEVVRQVCGMQILDPELLKSNYTTKLHSTHDAGKEGTRLGAVDEVQLSQEDVQGKILTLQEIISQLLACVANSGLLCNPRSIALHEQLSLQEVARMQAWIEQTQSHCSCLFDVSRWREMINHTTESALMKCINAALRRVNNVWNSLLQRICVESRCYEKQPSSSHAACMQKGEEQEREVVTGPESIMLSQLSKRLFSQSISVSELIASVYYNNWKKYDPFCSSSNLKKGTNSSSKSETAMNSLLAHSMVQRVWSQTTKSSNGEKNQDTRTFYSNDRNSSPFAASFSGCMSVDMIAAVMGEGKHMLGAGDGEDILLLFAEDDDGDNDDAEGEAARGSERNSKNMKEHKAMGGGRGGGAATSFSHGMKNVENRPDSDDDNNNQTIAYESRVLLYMLQRIFDADKTCTAVTQTSIHNCITAWISGAVAHVKEIMRSKKEEYEHQMQEKKGESFERHATVMVLFHRLSSLVEILLGVLEASPTMPAAVGPLIQELRDTVIACHTPWIHLLRREWESGLCTMYREALAAVTHSANGGSASSLARQRYTLEYAACWRRASPHVTTTTTTTNNNNNNKQEQQGQTVAYPVHLTPHVGELLFTLQRIVYKVNVGHHLREIVLPIIIRELVDGMTAAMLNAVLPSLISRRNNNNNNVESTMHSNPAGARYATTTTSGSGGDEDEREEALLQLYFDVLFITGLLAPPGVLSTSSSSSSTASVLHEIEEHVDKVTWSLASPLLISANEQLLRATSLSFGSWSSTAAAGVWGSTPVNTITGGGAARVAADVTQQPARSFSGAIPNPTERDRFPLLPLAMIAPSLHQSAVGGGGDRASSNLKGMEGTMISRVAAATGANGNNNNSGGWDSHSMSSAASVTGKDSAAAPSFTTSLLWGDGRTKGWMGSLWQ